MKTKIFLLAALFLCTMFNSHTLKACVESGRITGPTSVCPSTPNCPGTASDVYLYQAFANLSGVFFFATGGCHCNPVANVCETQGGFNVPILAGNFAPPLDIFWTSSGTKSLTAIGFDLTNTPIHSTTLNVNNATANPTIYGNTFVCNDMPSAYFYLSGTANYNIGSWHVNPPFPSNLTITPNSSGTSATVTNMADNFYYQVSVVGTDCWGNSVIPYRSFNTGPCNFRPDGEQEQEELQLEESEMKVLFAPEGTYASPADWIDLSPEKPFTADDLRKIRYNEELTLFDLAMQNYDLLPKAVELGIPLDLGSLEAARHKMDLFLFPNPARNGAEVIVQMPVPGQSYTISLFDMNGKELRQLKTADARLSLMTSDLSPGIYVLKAQSGQFTGTQRLVISGQP